MLNPRIKIVYKWSYRNIKQTNSMASVRERTILTERPPLVEVSSNFCSVVSVADLCGRILGFLDRSRYFFFPVAAQLYSKDWVNPVPDPLLFRKSGSAGNRTRTSGSVARNSDLTTRTQRRFYKGQDMELFHAGISIVPPYSTLI
jgi:hypothetical protein